MINFSATEISTESQPPFNQTPTPERKLLRLWRKLLQAEYLSISDNQTPLFFVPGGCGNVLYSYPLAEQLSQQPNYDRPFYGLQARGLDGVTPPLSDLQTIASEMIREIKQVQPQGPYCIGGHCVGSLIAFTITQQLVAAGDQIERLLVLDAPAPHFATRKSGKPSVVLSNARWIATLVDTIAHMTDQQLAIDSEALEPLEFDKQLDRLRTLLAQAGVVPGNVPLTQIRGLLQVFIANALLRYENQQTIYPIPINLFRAREINPHYDYRAHDDQGMDSSRSSLGWQQYAKGRVRVQLVDGDHITLLGSEQSTALANAIARTLPNTPLPHKGV